MAPYENVLEEVIGRLGPDADNNQTGIHGDGLTGHEEAFLEEVRNGQSAPETVVKALMDYIITGGEVVEEMAD